MKNISLIFILLSTITSCDYITSLNKTGDTDSIEILSQNPVEIVIDASCNIQLIDSKSDTITLSGYNFVIEDYQFKQVGQQLIINHKNGIYLQREKMGTLLLPINQIKSLTINAPSIIASRDTLHIQSLTIVINGRGIYSETDLLLNSENFNLIVYGGNNQTKHHLTGQTTNCSIFVEGCAPIQASELQCQSLSITHRSIADCSFIVDRQLTANIYSSGNVYYSGDPTISCTKYPTSLMSASGNVIQHK